MVLEIKLISTVNFPVKYKKCRNIEKLGFLKAYSALDFLFIIVKLYFSLIFLFKLVPGTLK